MRVRVGVRVGVRVRARVRAKGEGEGEGVDQHDTPLCEQCLLTVNSSEPVPISRQ